MPWYLHATNEAPETGTAYPDKPAALADRVDGQTVSLIADDAERVAWQTREQDRFDNDTYAPTPWDCRELCDITAGCWRCDLSRRHFPHLSINHPGLIAYTPNDEYGIADRQLRVKPGKYLTEFAPHLSQAEIDWFVGAVKAHDGRRYAIATSAADIRAVYENSAVSSCMAHDADAFRSDGIHPVEVYGDSDLAVAYLGSLSYVTARCVIWPEKKIRTRLYGDETLRALLDGDGYRSGNLDGARVRAIRCSRGYAMPYIDAADGADLDGKYFFLGSGDYSTKETTGIAGEVERHYCQRDGCDNMISEDDCYCSSCDEDRFYCGQCNEDTWDGYTEVADGTYVCDSCARNDHRDCEICDEDLYPTLGFSQAEQQERARRHVADLCHDCAETHRHCDACDDYVDRYALDCDCGTEAPAERCQHTRALPLEAPADPPTSETPVPEAPCYAF